MKNKSRIQELLKMQGKNWPIGLKFFFTYNPAQMYIGETVETWVKEGEPNTLEEVFALFEKVSRGMD